MNTKCKPNKMFDPRERESKNIVIFFIDNNGNKLIIPLNLQKTK